MPIASFQNTQPLIDVPEIKPLAESGTVVSKDDLKAEADALCSEHFYFFFNEKVALQEPRWHRSHAAKNPRDFANSLHWTEAAKAMPSSEDIKLVWELSRFHWCTVLARATRAFKDEKYLTTLNQWLDDWRDNNPINQGLNWSCGQETSYRVIHILMTHFILESKTNPALEEFVSTHLTRISRTLGYGIAQKSNHGVTESVALFIGGAWLAQNSASHETLGLRCQKQGRSALKKLIAHLIQNDGSFAMYSSNYQRVTMQLLSFALYSVKKLQLEPLGADAEHRIEKLVRFHETLVDPVSGETPNLGANDGAYPLKLNSADFRDHRPACILLRLLVGQHSPLGNLCEDLVWFDLAPFKASLAMKSPPHYQNFPDAGLVVITPHRHVKALLRYPAFRFRPSQSDIGHFDLWINGINALCDRGTYNYTSQGALDFSGTESHNTLWAPGTEAMRKVGPFLYKDWPSQGGGIGKEGAFSHLKHPYIHKRSVIVESDQANIQDEFKCLSKPFISWNLASGQWSFVSENVISNGRLRLEIVSAQGFSLKLVEETRADYYNSLIHLACLKIYSDHPEGSITTRVSWENSMPKLQDRGVSL